MPKPNNETCLKCKYQPWCPLGSEPSFQNRLPSWCHPKFILFPSPKNVLHIWMPPRYYMMYSPYRLHKFPAQ